MAGTPSTPKTLALLRALTGMLRKWADAILRGGRLPAGEVTEKIETPPAFPPDARSQSTTLEHPVRGPTVATSLPPEGVQANETQAAGLERSRLEASGPSFGPPPHWLERVRQGAPGLLSRAEDGGIPTQFAQELERSVQEGLRKRSIPGSSQTTTQRSAPPTRQQEAAAGGSGPQLPAAPNDPSERLPAPRRERALENRGRFRQSTSLPEKEDQSEQIPASLRREVTAASSSLVLRAVNHARQAGRQLFGRGKGGVSGEATTGVAEKGSSFETDRPASPTSSPDEGPAIASSRRPITGPPIAGRPSPRDVRVGPRVQSASEQAPAKLTSKSEPKGVSLRHAAPTETSGEPTPKSSDEGRNAFPESSAAWRASSEASAAGAARLGRVQRSGLTGYPTLGTATHSERRLNEGPASHRAQKTHLHPPAPGSAPSQPMRIAPVSSEQVDDLHDRWPELPEEPPPLVSELAEAVRALERAKRLDLEQRGEDPWSG